jgi:hypothetical protein
MRIRFDSLRVAFGSILIPILAATTVTAARAGSDGCCGAPPFPKVVYASPPVPFVVAPAGYVLDPADAVAPFYVVNRHAGFGPVAYARPTYSEGGYAFAYPNDFPYVASYGYGMRFGYRAWPARWRGDPFARPYGGSPYSAYRYRVAPSARIIHVPSGD